MAEESRRAEKGNQRRGVLVALLLLAAAACSGGGGSSTTQSSSTSASNGSTSSADKSSAPASSSKPSASSASTSGGGELHLTTSDPCALITQQQADALVGVATQPIPGGTATLDKATPDEIQSLAINAPGADVTLSTCAYGDAAQTRGVALSIYTLASGSTGTFPTTSYRDDVTARLGVPAVQSNANGVSAQLGWTHAVIDKTHAVSATAQKDPDLCLRTMEQVLANLR